MKNRRQNSEENKGFSKQNNSIDSTEDNVSTYDFINSEQDEWNAQQMKHNNE